MAGPGPSKGLLSKLSNWMREAAEHPSGLEVGGGRALTDYATSDLEAGAAYARKMQHLGPGGRKAAQEARRKGDKATVAAAMFAPIGGLLMAPGEAQAQSDGRTQPAALSYDEAKLMLGRGTAADGTRAPLQAGSSIGEDPGTGRAPYWGSPADLQQAAKTGLMGAGKWAKDNWIQANTDPIGFVKDIGSTMVEGAQDAGNMTRKGAQDFSAGRALGNDDLAASGAVMMPLGLLMGTLNADVGGGPGALADWGKSITGAPFRSRLARSLTEVGARRGPAQQLLQMAKGAPSGVAHAEEQAMLRALADAGVHPSEPLKLDDAVALAEQTNPSQNIRGMNMGASRQNSSQTPGNRIANEGDQAYEGYSVPQTRMHPIPMSEWGGGSGLIARDPDPATRNLLVRSDHFGEPTMPHALRSDNLLAWAKNTELKHKNTGEATHLIHETQSEWPFEKGLAGGGRQVMEGPDASPIIDDRLLELSNQQDAIRARLSELSTERYNTQINRDPARLEALQKEMKSLWAQQEHIGRLASRLRDTGEKIFVLDHPGKKWALPGDRTPFETPFIDKSSQSWQQALLGQEAHSAAQQGLPIALVSPENRMGAADLPHGAAQMIYGDKGGLGALRGLYEWLGANTPEEVMKAQGGRGQQFATRFNQDADQILDLIQQHGLPGLPRGRGR